MRRLRQTPRAPVRCLTRRRRRATCASTDAEVNRPVDKTHTALQLAARMGHLASLETLLAAAADVNLYGPGKETVRPTATGRYATN